MSTYLFALGFLALVAGVLLVYVPAGLITAGVLFVAWGVLLLETSDSDKGRR